MTANPNAHLHCVYRIVAGTRHANALPQAPEGRELQRVWTVIDPAKLKELGPVHNVSAFLEDRVHDWRLVNGRLHFYSRVVETDSEADIVLDFETDAERAHRMGKPAPRPRRTR